MKTHHDDHIPGWPCQNSSGSNCERMVGREHDESFSHMNQLLNSVKVFGMCWRRLFCRVLDSCIVNTRSWPKKMDAPLDGNNVTFISNNSCHGHHGIWPVCVFQHGCWGIYTHHQLYYAKNTSC